MATLQNSINNTLTATKVVSYTETVISSNSGTSYAFDFNLSRTWKITLTGNVTFTVSNVPASGVVPFTVHIIQGSGPYTVTWFSTAEWPGGVAPTISTTSGHRDIFVGETIDGNTTFQMMAAAQNYTL